MSTKMSKLMHAQSECSCLLVILLLLLLLIAIHFSMSDFPPLYRTFIATTHTHTHLFHFIIVNVHTSVCKIVNISVDYEFSIPTFPPQRKRLMHTYMPHVSLICALKTQSLNSQLSHFILFVSLIFHIVPRI